MKYALTGRMSKEVDRFTIDKMGVPSLVLMERAAVSTAMKVAEIVALFRRNVRILAVCGKGNNGADAVAAARILSWHIRKMVFPEKLVRGRTGTGMRS